VKLRQTSAVGDPGNARAPRQSRRSHLILTIHGIRTYGDWQERLERLLRGEDPTLAATPLDVRHYRYGFFTLLSFLVPWFRNLAVKKFGSHLSASCSMPTAHTSLANQVRHLYWAEATRSWSCSDLALDPQRRSVRECGLRKRKSLVLQFWWYGTLCVSGRISGERARMKRENGTR
jgi:hypothetical protein